MNVAVRRVMTIDEFLAWEEKQELRYEFDGHRAHAMAGGTRDHAAIQANLITALRNRLRGQPCQAYGSELKMRLGKSVRYHDAMIVCTPGRGRATSVDDPIVVFEIVSESSGAIDHVTKNFEYRNTPSIQRYVIIEQTVIGAEVFARAEDWTGRVHGRGSVLPIPEAGIELPLDELYEGLDLAA